MAEKRVIETQLLYDQEKNVENVAAYIAARGELSHANHMLELAIKKQNYLQALKDSPKQGK